MRLVPKTPSDVVGNNTVVEVEAGSAEEASWRDRGYVEPSRGSSWLPEEFQSAPVVTPELVPSSSLPTAGHLEVDTTGRHGYDPTGLVGVAPNESLPHGRVAVADSNGNIIGTRVKEFPGDSRDATVPAVTAAVISVSAMAHGQRPNEAEKVTVPVIVNSTPSVTVPDLEKEPV